jgi:hypothetical protein
VIDQGKNLDAVGAEDKTSIRRAVRRVQHRSIGQSRLDLNLCANTTHATQLKLGWHCGHYLPLVALDFLVRPGRVS